MLRSFSKEQGLPEKGTVTAIDHMDDGTPIALSVTVDQKEGSAVFDFEGTGPEVYNSCNAPPAVTYSAIIYSLRCMVRSEIPLNQVFPLDWTAPPHLNACTMIAGLRSDDLILLTLCPCLTRAVMLS